MTAAGESHPEIKFRWCRTVPCRTPEVWLVLTSLTGTRVRLPWQPHLGWYEARPSPVPCGLHAGFILIRDKVRDAVTGGLLPRERDYRVDPFHVVPHKFAVELFLESDRASPFWSDVPELRLRYLSSDHLERLLADSDGGRGSGGLRGRRWVSSASLSGAGDRGGTGERSSGIPEGKLAPGGGLTRGGSHSQLTALSSTPLASLRDRAGASASSPNLSRAFQVAVDLSRASSKFLAGLSSTSSGVCLGFEDGSDPPSPDIKDSAHVGSPYAAGGETSQDSEGAGEGARRKKPLLHGSRDRPLRIEDLAAESWGREGSGSHASSASFEGLLATVSASRRAAFRSELNLLRFDASAQERLVKEILAPSDSDFEDEEGACGASDSDLAGRYGCVITFESRSPSMDDVGSPRALEDVLVSLTSSESHAGLDLEPSSPEEPPGGRRAGPALEAGGGPRPAAAATPAPSSGPSSLEDLYPSVPVGVSRSGGRESSAAGVPGRCPNAALAFGEGEASGPGKPLRTTPDIEEDVNFQYESLRHEEEHFPIDIRDIDSEDSLEGAAAACGRKPAGGEEEPRSQSGSSGRIGSYDVGPTQPVSNSLDFAPQHSQRGTVREARYFECSPSNGESPREATKGEVEAGEEGNDGYSPKASEFEARQGPPDEAFSSGVPHDDDDGEKDGGDDDDGDDGEKDGGVGSCGKGEGVAGGRTSFAAGREGGGGEGEAAVHGGRMGGGSRSASRRREAVPARLRNAATQTAEKTLTSRATSTRGRRCGGGGGGRQHGRPPLGGQAEAPFSPLPDRFSEPWSRRATRGAPAAQQPLRHSPPPPDLSALQRSLHHNTLLLRALQAEALRGEEPPRGDARRRRPASPVRYRYPVLDSSVVRPSSSSSPSWGSGGGGGAVGGVRGASSLPELYNTATSTYAGPSRPTPTAHLTSDPRRTHLTHAHSAVDLMVGSSRSARLMRKHWDNESDSGGSTDSLIDEAEHVTTTPLDPHVFSVYSPMHGWDVQHRKQHRQRRRRTRSHHGGFSAWRGEAEVATGVSSGRPYLPYRSDQLSPGQQVKVIAPGGGVAVARVLTHKKSSWLLGDKTLRDSSVTASSTATVTVILLSEPNRLQGSVVTIPLEKILLAWPRT